MQHPAGLNHVVDVLKLIGIQDVQLLESNIMLVPEFSCCVGQAVGADINCRDLRIFLATGVNDLVARLHPAIRSFLELGVESSLQKVDFQWLFLEMNSAVGFAKSEYGLDLYRLRDFLRTFVVRLE